MVESYLTKLINDGVITVDDEGRVWITEKAWRNMTTTTAHKEEPWQSRVGGVPRKPGQKDYGE